jgi:hypothetical protein
MSTIGIFVGSEISELGHSVEDPSSTLRLSAMAALWAASNGHTVLALGDAPALLAVGTAAVGFQQGRVLEGGERRKSPVRVLSLLASENADRDRSLSFQRRRREGIHETPGPEETPEEELSFGDLSLLVDLGVMDIVGDSQFSLQPQSPEMVARILGRQLFSERPRAILAIGQVPEAVSRITLQYTREMKSPFACVLSRLDGAEQLTGAEQIPRLNNRRLRFRDRQPSSEEVNDDVYDTTDAELVRAANQATWEAEVTFRMYQWLTSIPG